MSSLRLHEDRRSAFFSHANRAHGVVDAGSALTSVKSEAAALLERFLAKGEAHDLYSLAGLLATRGSRESEAYEAVSRFVQSVTEFTPEGDAVAPDELAHDLLAGQMPPEAAPAKTPELRPVECDLSAWVTVFVTTVGYPTFERCMECLQAQDCDFRLKVIENVAPMSAAFQRMLDECETPFYVQVDEDMLLYPQAVRTLYERMSRLDDAVAMYAACLYDEHIERAILGIQITRTEIARRYPLRDVEGFEWEQRSRWRCDGYTYVLERVEGTGRNSPQTLGLHGTYWTPLAIYVRYFVLELKRRMGTGSHSWVPPEAGKLLERFLERRTELDLYALGGILAGHLQLRLSRGRSKHFERYPHTPGFEDFRRFVQALSGVDAPSPDPSSPCF
jgi:hypothetical protein